MNDALSLLQAALPYLALLLMFAGAWRLSNMKVTLSWEAKTTEPEPSKDTASRNKAEREAYAREQIAKLPAIVTYTDRKPDERKGTT